MHPLNTQVQSPLLSYSSPSTDPDPLQINTNGEITIVTNNPGGYSDQASSDYVEVSSIVVDLGLVGSGSSDLTSDPTMIQITAPQNWQVSNNGLRFTFTPNIGHNKVFSNLGLTFKLANIPINDTEGTVELTITELASATGDPANPTIYPSFPLAARNVSDLIGKFPKNFSFGYFDISPATGNLGFDTTLSWSGSDANYQLEYPGETITQHGNGESLSSTDKYPDLSKGDGALPIEATTVFTLSATYTPPGGNPITLQRQKTASVSNPQIVEGSFQATPSTINYGDDATLSWKTTEADYCTIQIGNGPKQKVSANSFTQTPPFEIKPEPNQSIQLIAHNEGMQSDPVNLPLVAFNPPKINSFTPTSGLVNSGEKITLNWDTTSVVTAKINGSPVAVNGKSEPYTITSDETYTLECEGALAQSDEQNNLTSTVSVKLTVAQISNFTHSYSYDESGLVLDMAWDVTNAQSIIILISGGSYIEVDPPSAEQTFQNSGITLPGSTSKYKLNIPLKIVNSQYAQLRFTLMIIGMSYGGKQGSTLTWNCAQ